MVGVNDFIALFGVQYMFSMVTTLGRTAYKNLNDLNMV